MCAICQPLNSPPGDLVANFDIALRSSLNRNTHGTYTYIYMSFGVFHKSIVDWWMAGGGEGHLKFKFRPLFSSHQTKIAIHYEATSVVFSFLFVVEGLRAGYWKSWRRWIQPKQSPKTDIFFWNDRRHDFESPLALKIQSYYSPGLPLGLADRGFVIQRKNMRALQDPCFVFFKLVWYAPILFAYNTFCL